MAYMRDSTGTRLDSFPVASSRLRRRDCPGWRALPGVNTAAATATAGASGAATTITGSTLLGPWEASCFGYFGAKVSFSGSSYPFYTLYSTTINSGGVNPYPTGLTSPSPYAVEFDLDTPDGKFEILQRGSGGGIRVMVNGHYISSGPTFAPAADGGFYLQLVTLAAGAGTYRIRLECSVNTYFGGIRVSPLAAVIAAPPRPQRWLVLGDSYTEPTISDNAASIGWDGWVQQLSYALGVDMWSAGRGGTGYLQQLPSGSGANNFLQRINDVIANAPDVVIFAGGINDYANATAAAIGAQALACCQAIKTALPNTQLIVLSPFFPRGFQSYPTNLLATADAIKAAAQTVDATYLDLLRLPAPPQGAGDNGTVTAPAASTLAAAAASGATSLSAGVKYPNGTYLQIGTGTNAEVRRCTGTSGTGPYTVNFGGNTPSGGGGGLSSAHVAGETVTPVGPGYLSGLGRLGNATGDGNAERFTGTDATHPTIAGHRNIARAVFSLLTPTLAA